MDFGPRTYEGFWAYEVDFTAVPIKDSKALAIGTCEFPKTRRPHVDPYVAGLLFSGHAKKGPPKEPRG